MSIAPLTKFQPAAFYILQAIASTEIVLSPNHHIKSLTHLAELISKESQQLRNNKKQQQSHKKNALASCFIVCTTRRHNLLKQKTCQYAVLPQYSCVQMQSTGVTEM